MSNEIDILMDEDPLGLTKPKIDAIIAYHREYRAKRAEGGPRAKRDTGPKLGLGDLVKGMVGTKPQAPVVKRRL